MTNTMEGCVMLALSTFRKSEAAIATAIKEAKTVRKLCVVFVADMNLARYYIEAEVSPDRKEMYETEILKLDEKEALAYVDEIVEKVKLEGIEMKSIVKIGRFALVCLDLVNQEKPSLIVTTRSQRPGWVRRVFGSPVNELVERASCPVIVV